MDGDDLRIAYETIGWSRLQLAKFWDCDESTIRQMEKGQQAVPDELAEWIIPIWRFHERYPPPPHKWQRGPGRRKKTGLTPAPRCLESGTSRSTKRPSR